jgi:hypothetical protein
MPAPEQRLKTRVVRRAPDATDVQAITPEREYWTKAHWPGLQTERSIDSGLAMQLAVFEILAALRPYSVDTEALLNGQHEYRQMKFERIIIDHATQDSDLDPVPSAAIGIVGEQAYEADNLSLSVLEETVDRFGPGTVLKKVSHTKATLTVTSILGHKDDRGGVKKAWEDAFLDEPEDERAGRHVVVKAYYERVVRVVLKSVSFPDNAGDAQGNKWKVVATLDADVDVVKLVKSPGVMHPPQVGVDASST